MSNHVLGQYLGTELLWSKAMPLDFGIDSALGWSLRDLTFYATVFDSVFNGHRSVGAMNPQAVACHSASVCQHNNPLCSDSVGP